MRNTAIKWTKKLDLEELLHEKLIAVGRTTYYFTLRRKLPKQIGIFFRQHILSLWTYYLVSQFIIIFCDYIIFVRAIYFVAVLREQ